MTRSPGRTRSLAGALILAALGAGCSASAPDGLETVFVVRHLQKDLDPRWDDFGDLRPLSEKGVHCAAALAERLREEGVGKVISTERVRTLATGAAVAGVLEGVSIVGDNESARPTPADLARIREGLGPEDRALLVVGHSNTVTQIVLAFRPDAADCLEELGLVRDGIDEARYGEVWQVDLGAALACAGGVRRWAIEAMDGVDCATP